MSYTTIRYEASLNARNSLIDACQVTVANGLSFLPYIDC